MNTRIGFTCGLLLVVGVLHLVPSTRGHGRLVKPPSRGSMWRFGYNTPPNYNDNQLFCGGVSVQYDQNGGRCGLCGDPYQGPREHEGGGKYAKGKIVETYMQGGTIEVDVDITANHKGWFEFRLCANNDPSRAITQECLDEHLLHVSGSGVTRVYIGTTYGIIRTYLDLPAGLTCSQCVLQWKYNAGNSWGTDPDGTSCVGCGEQEQFYGCADVAISGDGGPIEGTLPPSASATTESGATGTNRSITTTSPTAATTATSGGDWDNNDDSNGDSNGDWGGNGDSNGNGNGDSSDGECFAIGAWYGDIGMDAWCISNCGVGYCPESHCSCDPADHIPLQQQDLCFAVGAFYGNANMDSWCISNCALGYCPDTHCSCDPNSYVHRHDYCYAVGAWTGDAGMDAWCNDNCALGNCPETHCACDYPDS